jgi:hypothetical protein
METLSAHLKLMVKLTSARPRAARGRAISNSLAEDRLATSTAAVVVFQRGHSRSYVRTVDNAVITQPAVFRVVIGKSGE